MLAVRHNERDRVGDPIDGDEVLCFISVERNAGLRVVDQVRSDDTHRVEQCVRQLQAGIEAMERGGESCLGITHDDGWPKDRRWTEKLSAADELFSGDFALLVGIAHRLANVEFRLKNNSGSQSTDIGGGNVMEVANAGLAAEVEHILGAANV